MIPPDSPIKDLPTNLDVIAARKRLSGVAIMTPLLNAPQIDESAGRRVWVKAESLQRTGSFKFRGAWNRLTALKETGDAGRGVVAFSSGNHAQAVAFSAQRLGIEAVIIMPADAPDAKITTTRDYGAKVVLYDRATEDREAIGRKIQNESGAVLVPPFDDPFIIAGQGTSGAELAEQIAAYESDPLDLLVCCAGGGLASGISLAIEDQKPRMRVRSVEPAGFDDFARSLVTGEHVSNEQQSGSIQDALLTPRPGFKTFALAQSRFGPGLAVTDEEALRAMALAWRWLRLVLEPGGAAALAAALFRRDAIEGDAVAVIASGGNVDPARFAEALATLD